MKNKDKEKLSVAFRIAAAFVALLMIVGFVLQAFTI